MPTVAEYAILAQAAYNRSRKIEANKMPLPSADWSVVLTDASPDTLGFAGSIYWNRTTNEVVVGYEGTDLYVDPTFMQGLNTASDAAADILGALGFTSGGAQFVAAARLFDQAVRWASAPRRWPRSRTTA